MLQHEFCTAARAQAVLGWTQFGCRYQGRVHQGAHPKVGGIETSEHEFPGTLTVAPTF
jgi:hypothetical protein